MESIEHLELKRLAVAWLARLGCRAIATEVRCPIAKYRVDAAGWLDHADGSLLDAGGLEGRKRRRGCDPLRRRGPRDCPPWTGPATDHRDRVQTEPRRLRSG